MSTRLAAILGWFLTLPILALGQVPHIAGLLPAGCRRGGSATIVVQGDHLQGASALISRTGVMVRSVEVNAAGTQATMRVEAADEAGVGPREVRLYSSAGVSNPARIWIDPFPETIEVEPNDDAAHAQGVEAPVVANGRIQADRDLDTYSIRPAAGETWVVDCNACRITSRLLPVLELRDGGGKVVASAAATASRDPRIIYHFEQGGLFFVTVRDAQGKGGPDFVYRLTLGALPVVTSFLPRGERPGRRLGLELHGENLGRTSRAALLIPPEGPFGDTWVSVNTERGASLPIPLRVDSAAVAGLTETDATMPLPLLPVNMDGTFARYPWARFFFVAGRSERYTFALICREIGSPVDGTLRVLDENGTQVASAKAPPGGDARLDFTPPINGIFTIEARDQEGNTGPGSYFRLEARKVEPEFALSLDQASVAIPAGGIAKLVVSVERLGGFAGPVTLRAEDLPPGVTCAEVAVLPGSTSAELVFTVAAGATPACAAIHIRGQASIDGRAVIREAPPREGYVPRAPAGAAATFRVCDLLPLAIVRSARD